MAFDLVKLQEDAASAATALTEYRLLLRRFVDARTEEGIDFTAAQKNAIKTAAVAHSNALVVAADAIKAQHDAN